MNTRRLLTILFAICCTLVSPARAATDEAEKDVLKGYSAAARRIVQEMDHAVKQLYSYSDEGVIRSSYRQGDEGEAAPMAFAWVRPGSVRVTTTTHEIASDGETYMVVAKSKRRYTSGEPPKDWREELQQTIGQGGYTHAISVPAYLLDESPIAYLARKLRDLTVDGVDNVGGEPCDVLVGFGAGTMKWGGGMEFEQAVTIWVSRKDRMIRRVETRMEFVETDEEPSPETAMMRYSFGNQSSTYEAGKVRTNEAIDPATFRITPDPKFKKVKYLFNQWQRREKGFGRYPISGRELPAVRWETTRGVVLTPESLKGQPALIVVDTVRRSMPMPGSDGSNSTAVALAEAYAAKGVRIVLLTEEEDVADAETRGGDAADLIDIVPGVDPEVREQLGDSEHFSGIVAVGKDGKIQGLAWGFGFGADSPNLDDDVDRLVAGETLSSGVALNDEELDEWEEQKHIHFNPNAPEPINEQHLRRAWRFSMESGAWGFSAGGGAIRSTARGFWVPTEESFSLLGADGKVAAKLRVPRADAPARFGAQTAYAILADRGEYIVARLRFRFDDSGGSILSRVVSAFGQPKEPSSAYIEALNAEGAVQWEFELQDPKNHYMLRLQSGNLDGDGGDEVLFFDAGSLTILSAAGELLVRKPVSQYGGGIFLRDLDGDRRDEIYLSTGERMIRYDYRPARRGTR